MLVLSYTISQRLYVAWGGRGRAWFRSLQPACVSVHTTAGIMVGVVGPWGVWVRSTLRVLLMELCWLTYLLCDSGDWINVEEWFI